MWSQTSWDFVVKLAVNQSVVQALASDFILSQVGGVRLYGIAEDALCNLSQHLCWK